MTFELFDPKAEYSVSEGNLPHWYQPGVTYFVTFRTEDSVPQELHRAWHLRRDTWLREHGFTPGSKTLDADLAAADELYREFHTQFTADFHRYLDRGHGLCLLRNRSVAEFVAQTLRHFEGERYFLGDFVIMPNHVHLLVCLIGSTDLVAQCRSWKRYSAKKINHATGRHGRFWQEESFDHLVRSDRQFEHLRRYIADNPRSAGIAVTDCTHWRRPKL